MNESAPGPKTTEEILKMTGTVSFPPHEGWHPAGTSPEHQHSPTLALEGMLFDEPLDKDNCVTLNGTKFRVVWDKESFAASDAVSAGSGEVIDDGSGKAVARLELAE